MKKPTKSKTSGSRTKHSQKRSRRQASPPPRANSKTATLLTLLSRPEGVTVNTMAEAVGWQMHSVRGFLVTHVGKKLGRKLSTEKGPEGLLRYRMLEG